MAEAAPEASPSSSEFPVEGMTCAACAARLTRVLQNQEDILEAHVNFAASEARVVFAGKPLELGALRQVVQGAGFELPRAPGSLADEAGSQRQRARRDIQILAAATVASAGLSAAVMALTMGHATGPGWLPALLTALIVFGAGASFWARALAALRHRSATMDSLVVLGAGTAWAWSSSELVTGHAVESWFDGAAMLVTFILLGRLLEALARGRAMESIRGLMDLRPARTRVLRSDGSEEEVPIELLDRGDRVVVLPGQRVPVDGCVLDGRSSLDESAMTGEPVPVDKESGDEVLAGTVNGGGRLLVLAQGIGEDSLLERVIRSVREAQGRAAPVQALADRVSGLFVPGVVVLALLVALGWFLGGAEGEVVVRRFVTVVVIACPCALGLATPVAILVGSGLGARRGILVQGGDALQAAERATHVVFDKTGTLTAGAPRIVSVSRPELLPVFAAAEQPSEHPLGRAVVARAEQDGLECAPPEAFEAIPGRGIRATVEGRSVLLGSRRFLDEEGVSGCEAWDSDAARAAEDGQSVLWASIAGSCEGILTAADRLRDEAGAALGHLRAAGLDLLLLSGDTLPAAKAVAGQLGIPSESVRAGLLPQDKLAAIDALRGPGRTVVMVGDGINDAPALSAADVGIALGGGADVALEAADLALVSSDLHGVARAIELSRSTMRIVRQNLAWAFGYNLLLIPVAAGALTPWGLDIGPAWAGAAMALSSLSVVVNALRLKGAALG